MAIPWPTVGVLVVISSLTSVAAAEGPLYSSDGVYAGAAVGSGVALVVGYDLDVYLSPTRRFSLGPGFAATFFGAEAPDDQRQDYTLEVDPLRFKVQVGDGAAVRPYGLLAVGFVYGRFPAAGGLAVGDAYAATMTVGAGADFWLEEHWALTTLLQSRLRLSAADRLPIVWVELAAGVRFGM
ncbi:MAG: hypothetical protein DRJ42_15340 [Deltaproteobacteria bacterium]|nr:MAG: hypothetical protein DRJ42_15340 [Deltaproteobacteria bacterium]